MFPSQTVANLCMEGGESEGLDALGVATAALNASLAVIVVISPGSMADPASRLAISTADCQRRQRVVRTLNPNPKTQNPKT